MFTVYKASLNKPRIINRCMNWIDSKEVREWTAVHCKGMWLINTEILNKAL
jgi:hypothetical protein